MKLRIENDEITQAVIELIQAKVVGSKVATLTFTRQKGGQVYAEAEVDFAA
jgi:hypothetical protein